MDSKPIRGEVGRGSEKFSYLLVISQSEWRARVFRGDGAPHGWVACAPLQPGQPTAEEEQAARSWVERCIVYRVGLP